MKTVGLLGFELESDNLGCQALSFSLLGMLEPLLGGSPVRFRCFEPHQNLRFARAAFPQYEFQSCSPDLKRHALSVYRDLAECDVIIDGTYGDSFSDIYFRRSAAKNLLLKEMAARCGTVYILAPQTYGPFQSRVMAAIAANILRLSKGCYARDQKSAEYVRSISGVSAKVVNDLAFGLPYSTHQFEAEILKTGTPVVGLNVSGLLWRGGFERTNQFGLRVDYQRYIRGVLDGFLSRSCKVFLVPHVISRMPDSHDDDYGVCCEVEKMMGDPRVRVAPRFENCIEAKSFISGMDFFSGARMHATIAAYSSGVPVVPLSYSRKFSGVFDDLDYPWVLSGTELTTTQAVVRTLELFEGRDVLAERIGERRKETLESLRGFSRELAMVIQSV